MKVRETRLFDVSSCCDRPWEHPGDVGWIDWLCDRSFYMLRSTVNRKGL